MTRMNPMSAAAPTVTRPVGRRPVTRLVSRNRDPLVPNLLGSSVRFLLRDRRPRYLPVHRGVAWEERYALPLTLGNGTLVPSRVVGWSGASTHRTRTHVPGAGKHRGDSPRHPGYAVAMPRVLRIGCIALAAAILVAGCGASSGASFDPTGPCSADGRAPGAYPDLEALVPKLYQGAAPGTLDSGRNCTATNLGALASFGISEIRFAGATWSFGGERAVVLAVFRSSGLTTEAMGNFYLASARAAARTQVVASTAPMVSGRQGWRLDTTTSERTQTVVIWPSATADLVNVIISNDLPDARIQDAIDAFGGR